jgi:Domain of unknown function (DUF5664)
MAKQEYKRDVQEKLRFDLVPTDAEIEIVRSLTLGARKYGERNWELGGPWSHPYAALQRHSRQFWEGDSFDSEGAHHMAAVATNAMFLLAFDLRKIGDDDRATGQVGRSLSEPL